MVEYKLRQTTKDYVTQYVGVGTSHVSGKNSYVLPYSTPPSPVRTWTSNPVINGGITNNTELLEALFDWYDKYGPLFKVNTNILIAQAMAESGLKIWNYAGTSTASGINQFTVIATFDYIICNSYGHFTDAERRAISKDLVEYTYSSAIGVKNQPKTPFYVKYSDGKTNRQQLHQNIIDNPEIFIKAQCLFMSRLADRSDGVASCALFGYNRGPAHVKGSSYALSIASASKEPPSPNGKPYEQEGINYVFRIFKTLYDNFGYRELNMTKENRDAFDTKYTPFLG